jgi:hypothetical protein
VVLAKLPRVHIALKLLLTVSAMTAANGILHRAGLLDVEKWWDPYFYAGLSIVGLLVAASLERRLSEDPMEAPV